MADQHSAEPSVFLPLTGNPTGFHHLLLAECALRQFPEYDRVVFLLSNGQHPDPTKRQRILAAELRLTILRSVLADWPQPEVSYPVRVLAGLGEQPRLNPKHSGISTAEFEYDRPYRLAEHVLRLHEQCPECPVSLIIGADLVERMQDERIFSSEDLGVLASKARFLIVPRGAVMLEEALATTEKLRNVTLATELLNLDQLPKPLHLLLHLSSTLIRRAVQAGHSLERFVPQGAAQLMREQQLYRLEGADQFLNEWELNCRRQEQQLEDCAVAIKQLLDERARQRKPHHIAVVETSSGGRVAAAFTTVSGISKHFLGGVVPYDSREKTRLLERPVTGSSVTAAMAGILAEAGARRSGADFTLAETGMAGPSSPEHRSRKHGQCHLALSIDGQLHHNRLDLNPFLSRKEHQLGFALEALRWFKSVLESRG